MTNLPTPHQQARDLVDRSLHGQLPAPGVAWLRAHPQHWLEALLATRAAIRVDIRVDVDQLDRGTDGSKRQDRRRREVAGRNIMRRRYIKTIEAAIADVRSTYNLTATVTPGAAIETLTEIVAMLRDGEDPTIIRTAAEKAIASWTATETEKAA